MLTPATPTATDSARLHVRRRAWERFRVSLADPDIEAIEAMIRAGVRGDDYVPVRTYQDHGTGCTLHAVRFAWRWMPFLRDEKSGRVITVLPVYVLHAHQGGRWRS